MQYHPKSPSAPYGSRSGEKRILFGSMSFRFTLKLALIFCRDPFSPNIGTVFFSVRVLVWCNHMVLSINNTFCSLHTSMILRTSAAFAIGFSQRMCLLFFAALIAHSVLIPVGTGMYTASMFGSEFNYTILKQQECCSHEIASSVKSLLQGEHQTSVSFWFVFLLKHFPASENTKTRQRNGL